MRILFIGDIVARPGRNLVKEVLPDLIKQNGIDVVFANVENLAGGRGATVETIKEMQEVGVNYFTSGDHILWHKDFEDEIENLPVIRPANFPDDTPGVGHAIIDTGKKGRILLVNLMGRVSFGNNLFDDPFRLVDEILEDTRNEGVNYIIVDFHAEATSEKHALAFYLDGRANAVVGTHTHVPTCDHRKLPRGLLYVTDIGMTGVIDSVLGVKEEIIIQQFLTGRNQRFEWKNTGTKAFRSVLLDLQDNSIERYDLTFD